MDFTLDKYAELCRAVKESKYSCLTLTEYLQLKSDMPGSNCLILRHDIDRSPLRALEVARVESQYGLKSSYYFRAQKATYVPKIIDQIANLGHEIGYHYETLDKCKGNYLSAQTLFSEELAAFRTRYTVQTVCAHGNPLTPYDNKTIWKNLRLADYKLLGEAFLSLNFQKFAYFSDSGRTWLDDRSQKMPGKDAVETAFSNIRLRTTDDVINIVRKGDLPNICLLTHPERWCRGIVAYSSRFLIDMTFSLGKTVIFKLR